MTVTVQPDTILESLQAQNVTVSSPAVITAALTDDNFFIDVAQLH